jgi:uncharacterized repeat protein (TIGR01451 family)
MRTAGIRLAAMVALVTGAVASGFASATVDAAGLTSIARPVDPPVGAAGAAGAIDLTGSRRPSVIPTGFTRFAGLAAPPDVFTGLPAAAHAGYASGTVYHADAALSERRGANVEVGVAGAAFSSVALPPRDDELRRPIAPALAAGAGFGKGRGAKVTQGFGGEESDIVDLDDNAEANAPPSSAVVTKDATDAAVRPFFEADLLRAQASARAAHGACVIGSDIAYGLGRATDAALVQRSEDDPFLVSEAEQPRRGVSQSVARTRLVPLAQPGRFGMVSEVRQTIAPTTVFRGTPGQFTVEVGGEWVLRATADGAKGTFAFGPEGGDTGDEPLVTVRDKRGKVVRQLSAEDIRLGDGVISPLSDAVEIVIGSDPRAIGGNDDTTPTTTPTRASAAVDVVRIRLLNTDDPIAPELRVGHMEVAAAAPAGGVRCPGIGLVKQSDADTVRPGERFNWTITVSNPNDCVLKDVNVTDTVSAPAGVRYRVASTSPKARSSGGSGPVVFEDVGPIDPGKSRTLQIEISVDGDSATGLFKDEAVATGNCEAVQVPASGGDDVPAPMSGSVTLQAPEVTARLVPAPGAEVVPAPARTSSVAANEAAKVTNPAAGAATAGATAKPGRTSRPRPTTTSGIGLAATGARLMLAPGLLLLGSGLTLRRARRRAR